MQTGDITSYIDVAQLVLYAFWIFFFGIIIYLRREDKREGYPLESDRSGGRIKVQGFPAMPSPKTFLLAHGGSVVVPDYSKDSTGPISAEPMGLFPGAPLQPVGNPLLAGVGPGSYTSRSQTPDMTHEGHPKMVPMRVATDFTIAKGDPDPRGLDVVGADGHVAGVVNDLWVDRAEPQIRYYEVAVAGPVPRNVLLPVQLAVVDTWRNQLKVQSLLAAQFAGVPGLRNPDQIGLDEEDRISAYYGGGILYAEPSRQEPLL